MARGSRGGLVGRAGAEELADRRRWLHDEALRKLDADRLHREAAEIIEENDLIRMAIALEGETSFYKWWDDDTQVPSYGKRRERIKLLKERVAVHEGSVPKEASDGKKSQQEA